MPLINCKVELKFKCKRQCVLAASGVDNVNANDNNFFFTIKDTKLYVPVVTLSAKDSQKLSEPLSKGFERSLYWNEYKTESENKNTTNEYRYFLKSNFVLVYSNQEKNSKMYKGKIYYLKKGFIKNYNITINRPKTNH